ncbi:MAG: hypothetical protein HY940_04460 [Gammaproteobacteria bacterium]|nr:hypothetical protein [Gammaproteobacteria bacterium]
MSTEINLFRPASGAGTLQRQGKMLLLIALLAITPGLALVAYQVQAIRTLDRQLAATTASIDATVESLRLNNPQQRLQDINRDIDQHEQQLAALNHTRAAIAAELPTASGKYSEALIALARQHVDGLRLTGIDIEGNARLAGLAGESTLAELIPQYIGNLTREAVLSGTGFNALTISTPEQQDNKATPMIQFTLNNKGDEG